MPNRESKKKRHELVQTSFLATWLMRARTTCAATSRRFMRLAKRRVQFQPRSAHGMDAHRRKVNGSSTSCEHESIRERAAIQQAAGNASCLWSEIKLLHET